MAQAIRRLGLMIVAALLRLFVRPPRAGWTVSRRQNDLRIR